MAWKFLLDMGIDRLPLMPSRLAGHFSARVRAYSHLAAHIGISFDEVERKFSRDGCVFYSETERCFLICYNDSMSNSICRYTVTHELMHIFLGHVSPRMPTVYRVRGRQRDIIEAEANVMARRILCPSIVLHDCGAVTPRDIMRLCGISFEAACYRSQHMQRLEKRGLFGAHPLEREVERRFMPFIQENTLINVSKT